MAQWFQLYQHQGEQQIYSQLNIHQHLHRRPIFWSVVEGTLGLLKSSYKHVSNNSQGRQLEALHSSCLRWYNTEQSNRCQHSIVFEILSFPTFSFFTADEHQTGSECNRIADQMRMSVKWKRHVSVLWNQWPVTRWQSVV